METGHDAQSVIGDTGAANAAAGRRPARRASIEELSMSGEALARLDAVVVLFGLDGVILDANRTALDLYGHKYSELAELRLRDLLASGDQGRAIRQMCDSAQSGMRFRQSHVTAEGQPLPLEGRAIAVVAEGEAALMMMARDISDLTNARDSLVRHRSLLAQAEAVASIGSWHVCSPDRMPEWSHQMYEIFGVDAESFLGDLSAAAWEAVHPGDLSTLRGFPEAPELGGMMPLGTYRIVRPDGGIRWLVTRMQAQHDASGEIVALRGFTHDVTAARSAEEALLSSAERLLAGKAQFERMVYSVAEAMGRAVEARDPYTHGHQIRVAEIAKQIAQEMRLPTEQMDGVAMAAVVHDVGKLGVPVEILNKPGALTSAEHDVIRQHPQSGHEILRDIEFPWPVACAVLQHHERMDGSGYPLALTGDDICLEARIIAVADTIDAMVSDRPYRAAREVGVAIAEVAGNAEKYDANVVATVRRLYESGRLAIAVAPRKYGRRVQPRAGDGADGPPQEVCKA